MPEASLKKDFNLSLKTIEDSGIAIGDEQKGLKAFHYLYCRLKKPFPAAMVITNINPGYSYASTLFVLHEDLQLFPAIFYTLYRNAGSISLAMGKFIPFLERD
jgi:hypothetical protein